MAAVTGGDAAVVQALLGAGADFRAADAGGVVGDDLCGGGGRDRRDRGAAEARREAVGPRSDGGRAGLPCAGVCVCCSRRA